MPRWGLGGRFLLNIGKGRTGWSLASDADGVAVAAACLCLLFLFWSSQNSYGILGGRVVLQLQCRFIIKIL